MSEHAKCWHCGGTNLQAYKILRQWKQIVCNDCNAHGEPQPSEADAWAWWDARPIEAELRAQLAEAQAIIMELTKGNGFSFMLLDRAAAWLAAHDA